MKEADLDDNEKLDYNEFVTMMLKILLTLFSAFNKKKRNMILMNHELNLAQK
jgi:hypothetical protein